jgi:hypothetical protein
MNRKRRAGIRRYTVAAVIALPATVALFFLMTRLILSGEQDRDRSATRTIRSIEFQRAVKRVNEVDVPVFIQPQAIRKELQLTRSGSTAGRSHQSESEEPHWVGRTDKDDRAHEFDWQAEKSRLARELDDNAFERWLLEQGHERYATIMQGPLPITNSVHATSPPTQGDMTGYMNVFGDMEYEISENCVATTQVAARLDHSDFVKALPMVITCKPRLKQKFSLDRRDRD